jgi:NACHT domain
MGGGFVTPDRDNEFTARYLDYMARTLDRFEFFAVDPRGIMRTHGFASGYVPLTLSPRDVSDHKVTVGARADRALAGCARALVRGVAGSGKTTLLRWLAVEAARHQRGSDSAGREVPTGPGGVVPFLVELGRFPDGELPNLETLLPSQLITLMPAGWVGRMLDEGRALLLLDGLDEVRPRSREGVEKYVSDLSAVYPNARCVVTTRPSTVTEQWWVDRGFRRFDLLEMSRHSVEEFVRGWHQVARDDYPADTEADLEARRFLTTCERDLLDTLPNRPALRCMAANPLLCGLLCAIHLVRGKHLPEVRKQVYDDAVDLLLVRWRRGGGADGIRLGADEQLKLLQRLAYSLVTNRESVLSLDYARRRIGGFMIGLRSQDEDPERVLQYMAVHSGLLRELPDGSLQFVHRTFCDHLAAQEVVDEANLGLMMDNADKQHWHDVVVMASAHARPAEAHWILEQLLERGEQAEPARRDTLYLLAAAILEQVSVLSADPDKPDIRQLITTALAELIPPKSLAAADQLGKAGSFVLDLLPGPEKLPADAAARVVRTVAVIAAMWDPPGALEKILKFTATRSPMVMAQLIEPWGRYGDYEDYARTVLHEVNFREIPVDLQSGHRVSHIGHLTSITDLRLRGDVWDLSPLTELPELRQLRLEHNTRVDLDPLAGCLALRTLRLEQCSSVAATQPVDLSPLGKVRLDELIITGLLSKVDIVSLADARLGNLTVKGVGLRRELAALPARLDVHSITLDGVPDPAVVTALSRLSSLRRLTLCGVPPDAAIPPLPGVEVVLCGQ